MQDETQGVAEYKVLQFTGSRRRRRRRRRLVSRGNRSRGRAAAKALKRQSRPKVSLARRLCIVEFRSRSSTGQVGERGRASYRESNTIGPITDVAYAEPRTGSSFPEDTSAPTRPRDLYSNCRKSWWLGASVSSFDSV